MRHNKKIKSRWTLLGILCLIAFLFIAFQYDGSLPSPSSGADTPSSSLPQRSDSPSARVPAWLPTEAHTTLQLIKQGGPYPYHRDGTVFENREALLGQQQRGYYREYTVKTPGSPDRGARRIVTGGHPPVEFYYTDDHYRSFRRIPMERQ